MRSTTKHQYWEMQRCLRGADWRWQMAAEAAQSDNPLASRKLEHVAARVVEYLRLARRGEAGVRQAAKRFPDIAAAEQLRDQPQEWECLKLLVISNCDTAEIAQRLQIDQVVVVAAEAIFFDARPMLDSWDLIHVHVLAAETALGNHESAARMRLAYFGGPFAARALIEGREDLPTQHADRLHASSLLLHAKFAQAIEMRLSEAQLIDYLKLWKDIYIEEQQLQLERQKLSFQMQRWAQSTERRRMRDQIDAALTTRTPSDNSEAPASQVSETSTLKLKSSTAA